MGASAATEREQLQREERDRRRTEEAHEAHTRWLRESGRESRLRYGRRLYSAYHDQVALEITSYFEDFLLDPTKPGPHRAALPMFERFAGVDQIAAVTLTTALDHLSEPMGLTAWQQSLGRAIEDEHRGEILAENRSLDFRRLVERFGMGRRVVKPYWLAQLHLPIPAWTPATRQQVGTFLAEVLLAATDLFVVVKQEIGGGRTQFKVHPSAAAEAVMAYPDRPRGVTRTPMVEPPRPWGRDLRGGGHLTNAELLVKLPNQERDNPEAAAYLEQADMGLVLTAVNHLQGVPWRVDDQVLAVQREAWEAGITGLFPCAKTPLEIPPFAMGKGAQVRLRIEERERQARDLSRNRRRRIKTERALQLAEEVSGRVVWHPHFLDWRGRIYTSSRWVSHQGSDVMKAQLELAQAERVGDIELDWLLRSAAAHFGLSKATWKDRLLWGQRELHRIQAVAEAPLDRIELWREAKDPWQFFQACLGVARALREEPVGTPIRFDQCASGIGHLSCLLRDREHARLCNVVGEDPTDLYLEVKAQLMRRLEEDLHKDASHANDRALAERWLGMEIPRSLVKGPVLAVPYGVTRLSAADQIADWLDEQLGYVDVSRYPYEVGKPAQYLATRLWEVLTPYVAPARSVRKWLGALVDQTLRAKDLPLEWTTPSGFPMRIADREEEVTKVRTRLYGRPLKANIHHAPVGARLDATTAKRGVAANFTHSIDAAFLALFINEAAAHGIPMGTVHDCVAVRPHEADWCHEEIHRCLRSFHATSWLEVMHQEIQGRTGIELPRPPMVGGLPLWEIGSNPYAFC